MQTWKAFLVDWNSVDAILVQYINVRMVCIMQHVWHLAVSASIISSDTIGVNLPFINIFRDILRSCTQYIDDINNSELTWQIKDGDIKIDAHEAISTLVDNDICFICYRKKGE